MVSQSTIDCEQCDGIELLVDGVSRLVQRHDDGPLALIGHFSETSHNLIG